MSDASDRDKAAAPGASASVESHAGTASESDRIVMALLYLLVQTATRGSDMERMLAIGRHFEMLAGQGDISPPAAHHDLAIA